MTDWSVIVNVGGKSGFHMGVTDIAETPDSCGTGHAFPRSFAAPCSGRRASCPRTKEPGGVSSTPRPIQVIASQRVGAKRRRMTAPRSNPLCGSAQARWIASLRRNDDGHTFAFSRRNAPEVCMNFVPPLKRGCRECRVHAAPAVSCARCTKKNAHEHTGTDGAIRHSLRNGFTAYAVLSPATNSFCHRRWQISG